MSKYNYVQKYMNFDPPLYVSQPMSTRVSNKVSLWTEVDGIEIYTYNGGTLYVSVKKPGVLTNTAPEMSHILVRKPNTSELWDFGVISTDQLEGVKSGINSSVVERVETFMSEITPVSDYDTIVVMYEKGMKEKEARDNEKEEERRRQEELKRKEEEELLNSKMDEALEEFKSGEYIDTDIFILILKKLDLWNIIHPRTKKVITDDILSVKKDGGYRLNTFNNRKSKYNMKVGEAIQMLTDYVDEEDATDQVSEEDLRHLFGK